MQPVQDIYKYFHCQVFLNSDFKAKNIKKITFDTLSCMLSCILSTSWEVSVRTVSVTNWYFPAGWNALVCVLLKVKMKIQGVTGTLCGLLYHTSLLRCSVSRQEDWSEMWNTNPSIFSRSIQELKLSAGTTCTDRCCEICSPPRSILEDTSLSRDRTTLPFSHSWEGGACSYPLWRIGCNPSSSITGGLQGSYGMHFGILTSFYLII